MKIQLLPLTEIKPYWRNPRDNAPAVAAVKQSIESYGFNVPIVLDKNKVIIAGHTRYRAVIELGWDKVPCIVSDMDGQKAKAYRIADNKTSEFAVWNINALIPELREVTDLESMAAFFPEYDLHEMLADAGGASVTPATQKEIEKAAEGDAARFERGDPDSGLSEVTCPHCLETFMVAKESLA